MSSIRIDPARLAEAMRERRSADEAEQAALEGIPHIRVTYESDLLDAANHQATSDRVLAYLGLEMILVPVIICLPVHLVLRRLFAGR